MRVQLVAQTNNAVGDSDPSNIIKVSCPSNPPATFVTQQPSYKKGTVIMGWDAPSGTEHAPMGEELIFYRLV